MGRTRFSLGRISKAMGWLRVGIALDAWPSLIGLRVGADTAGFGTARITSST